MAIFGSMLHGFLPFSPVSSSELCSFWYGLKDLFTLHTKLSSTIKTEDITSGRRDGDVALIIIKSHFTSTCRFNKAFTLFDQHFLSCATTLATFQLFHPALFCSFSTVLLQVAFGLPLALQPSGVHPIAVKQLLSPSLLSI